MTEATNIPTGATPLDVMIGALENEIAALRKQNDALVAALEQTDEYIKRPDIDDDAHTLGIVTGLIAAALEQVK